MIWINDKRVVYISNVKPDAEPRENMRHQFHKVRVAGGEGGVAKQAALRVGVWNKFDLEEDKWVAIILFGQFSNSFCEICIWC